MAKISLPPGFRFHPTDVELVKYYLKRKVMRKKFRFEAIAEVNIYKYAPWDLPGKSCLGSGDLKWYFFCPREKKYANGDRMKRATEFGYWKTTGKDRLVHYNNEVVGMIKTLVFHRGKAPRGDRTDWVLHEYRIQEKDLALRGVVQDAYVLCVVFQKEGLGPRNGAQYGAPFREEDWNDDKDVDGMQVFSSTLLPPLVCNTSSPVATSSHVPESQCNGRSESCLSDTIPSIDKELPSAPINNDVPPLEEDDILKMLDIFTEDSTLVSNENIQKEKLDMHDGNVEATPCPNDIDIYNGLVDLVNLSGLSGVVDNFVAGNNSVYSLTGVSLVDNEPFLELCDLDAPLNSPAEVRESESIHIDEQYADQNSYIPEQLSYQVNPLSSHSPPMLPEAPVIEDQLVAFLKMVNDSGESWFGKCKKAPLNHGAATLFKQLPVGSNHAPENLSGSGSNYPW